MEFFDYIVKSLEPYLPRFGAPNTLLIPRFLLAVALYELNIQEIPKAVSNQIKADDH